LNALTAGRIISRKTEHLITEADIVKGQDEIYRLEANGQPIRVTIAWTDPAGNPNMGGLNDSAPALIDDLDLELNAPDGTLHYPYSLDLLNPLSPARHDRPNRVDNVEEVETTSTQGFWTIRVKGTRLGAPSQRYSLVTTGFLVP
jgi:hypothetical protein